MIATSALMVSALVVGDCRAAGPKSLPLLDCRVIGTLRLPDSINDGYVPRYQSAELDGAPGRELVILSGEDGDAALHVYTWKAGKPRLLVERPILAQMVTPAAGDLDRNGRDELYVLGADNRVVTLELFGSTLRAVRADLHLQHAVGSLVVSDVRSAGSPELVVAVDTTQVGEPNQDESPNRVDFYARRAGRWRRSWRQAVKSRQFALHLLAGDYHPRAGNELVLQHWPSEVSDATYEVMTWRAHGLSRLTRTYTDARQRSGLQDWAGVTTSKREGIRLYASTVFAPNDNYFNRGEVRTWSRGRLVATHTFPGRPVAVADFLGTGSATILVAKPEGVLTLLSPSRGK